MSRNFGEQFLKEILKFDDKPCLIYRNSEITFEEFAEIIEKWRRIIENQKNSNTQPLRIALFCTNSPDILAIIIAAQLTGITVIPLNPSYKKYEIDKYILESNANFIIVSNDVDLEKFEETEVNTISELLAGGEKSGNENKENKSLSTSGVVVFFSSGTTGPPKLFEYNQRILCAQIDQIKEIKSDSRFFSPSESDICYGVLPFFHAGGLVTVLSMIFSGCTILINERWNENEFLSNCQNYKVDVLFLVPPVLDFFANHPLVSNFDLSHLKTIYVGAAASPSENFSKVSKRLPTLQNLIQLYGTTECGVLLCSTGKGICTGKTVGLPYPLVELKINEKNEIMVKSATGVEIDFMETGDLGCLSYKFRELMIVGRVKEMMKVRGWQVNPNEIEQVIRKVESVLDCAVYQSAIPDKLIAKVIGKPDTKREIMTTVKVSDTKNIGSLFSFIYFAPLFYFASTYTWIFVCKDEEEIEKKSRNQKLLRLKIGLFGLITCQIIQQIIAFRLLNSACYSEKSDVWPPMYTIFGLGFVSILFGLIIVTYSSGLFHCIDFLDSHFIIFSLATFCYLAYIGILERYGIMILYFVCYYFPVKTLFLILFYPSEVMFVDDESHYVICKTLCGFEFRAKFESFSYCLALFLEEVEFEEDGKVIKTTGLLSISQINILLLKRVTNDNT